MAKTLVILNPISGMGRAIKYWSPIEDELHRRGVDFDDVRTEAPRIVIESPDPLAVEADGEVPWCDAHRLVIEALPKRLRVIA